MTAALHIPLVAKIADEFQSAYGHAFRLRSDAEDAARIALAACQAEELQQELAQSTTELEEAANLLIVCGLVGTASLLSDAAARNRTLLAKLDAAS